MNRLAKNLTVVSALLLLCAVPGPARGDSASRGAQAPTAVSPRAQKPASLQDDFAGLDLSDDQKEQIEKVRQETVRRQGVVAKDANLGPEQKDAMIQGYARLEYGQIFRLLTPDQQKLVRQKIAARRAAEKARKRPAPPAPPR